MERMAMCTAKKPPNKKNSNKNVEPTAIAAGIVGNDADTIINHDLAVWI
jgi:hypothetical protein